MEQHFHSHSPKTNQSQSSTHPLRIGRGQAHSKIILMGEHSVVYDYPAIAIPFDAVQVKVTVQASPDQESWIDCRYHTGRLNQAPASLDNLKKAIQLTLQSLHKSQDPLMIQIHSTIPQERGMGSSAAVVVALIRAICDYYQVPLAQDHLRLLTNEAEVIAHESTSGIDTLVTSSQTAYIYRKSRPAKAFDFRLDAVLVVADSGQAGRTRLAVNHVHQLRLKKPEFVEQSMATIGYFVNQAYGAIRQNDPNELGRFMTYNHYYLNQLGVSNPHLDQIINAAWLAGALGAKLTGGGLGGCVIALARDLDHAHQIAQAMRKSGAEVTWSLDLSQGLSTL
ncbi:mevalonate kinase [Facklamia languida]|uniref:Mevalonate kinase n=1 Tax=Facklamia languida CCUG 37842 TaxID=883113 RepID=H3NJ88_9LACT|nr:mevalonate kinase [Facklamia languida]EHR37020.1 mevalonate kinase [Facklamia languida CCUG 37842]